MKTYHEFFNQIQQATSVGEVLSLKSEWEQTNQNAEKKYDELTNEINRLMEERRSIESLTSPTGSLTVATLVHTRIGELFIDQLNRGNQHGDQKETT